MSQTEVLRLLNELGGICIVRDLFDLGIKNADKDLARLRKWGYVDFIPSVITLGQGPRVKIFYTL